MSQTMSRDIITYCNYGVCFMLTSYRRIISAIMGLHPHTEEFALYLTNGNSRRFWEAQNNFTPLFTVDSHGFRSGVQFYIGAC